jgi:hypothetical protein
VLVNTLQFDEMLRIVHAHALQRLLIGRGGGGGAGAGGGVGEDRVARGRGRGRR